MRIDATNEAGCRLRSADSENSEMVREDLKRGNIPFVLGSVTNGYTNRVLKWTGPPAGIKDPM